MGRVGCGDAVAYIELLQAPVHEVSTVFTHSLGSRRRPYRTSIAVVCWRWRTSTHCGSTCLRVAPPLLKPTLMAGLACICRALFERRVLHGKARLRKAWIGCRQTPSHANAQAHSRPPLGVATAIHTILLPRFSRRPHTPCAKFGRRPVESFFGVAFLTRLLVTCSSRIFHAIFHF